MLPTRNIKAQKSWFQDLQSKVLKFYYETVIPERFKTVNLCMVLATIMEILILFNSNFTILLYHFASRRDFAVSFLENLQKE